MHVFLSDRAFIGLVLSVIEVYKDECLGSLLGYNLRNRIVVDYVLPYQTARRKRTDVEPKLAKRVKSSENSTATCSS